MNSNSNNNSNIKYDSISVKITTTPHILLCLANGFADHSRQSIYPNGSSPCIETLPVKIHFFIQHISNNIVFITRLLWVLKGND